MILDDLQNKNLIVCPKWVAPNTQFLGMTGSVAYAASVDTSDMDVVGFCIPRKDDIFPHLRNELLDFGTQKQRFNVWQQHHIKDGTKEYDFSVYSIVRFFHLCMENNPNMVDVLFLPQRCIIHCTAIGQMVRDNRKMFLHKGSYHKTRGYAYASLKKIKGKYTQRFVAFCRAKNVDTEVTLEHVKAEIARRRLDRTPSLVDNGNRSEPDDMGNQ